MLESSISYILIRTLPESILIALAGKILLNIKMNKYETVKLGLLLGFLVSIIRNLPITFGVHTVLSMMLYGIVFIRISKKSIIYVAIATIEIFIALVLSEAIYLPIAMNILKIPYEILIDNTKPIGAICTLPSLVIFILVILIFNKTLKIEKEN